MERQSSRRRKGGKQQSQQPTHVDLDHDEIPRSTRLRPSIGIYFLILCALFVLAYSLQSNTPDPLQSLLSLRPPHSQKGSLQHDPDSVRPRIELHPDDHIYRGPLTQHLDWRVTADDLRPDGVLKRVYLINGHFPGPTIEARSGDTLVIAVTNALEDESITIHWHGLHVENSMDGATGITQSPIPPGAIFTYNLTIPAHQSGTFWYHSHSGLHRGDGLYGGFIVHSPAVKSTVRGLLPETSAVYPRRHEYDRELLLLIGDWYHRPAEQVLAWYMWAGSYGNEPVPDSLLINGAGSFDCDRAVPARPVDCIARQVNGSFLDLDRTIDYRIRVVNTGALAGFTLTFEQEHLELIQLDSNDAETQTQTGLNSAGILYPGQRMDVILRSPKQKNQGQSSLTVELDPECFKYPNPALTRTQHFPINSNTTLSQPNPNPIPNHLDLSKISSSPPLLTPLPNQPSQTKVVYTKIQKLSINRYVPYGYFNHTTWKPQTAPLIELEREEWDKNQFSIEVDMQARTPGHVEDDGGWVDLVVNNLDEGPHPFHMHGHAFYVLATYQADIGWGSYNPFADAWPPGIPASNNTHDGDSPFDLTRAVLRDTIQIPNRGYAVLRFRAENRGVWLFHCHILWHLAAGMAMVVDAR